jgi:hypothetical protein
MVRSFIRAMSQPPMPKKMALPKATAGQNGAWGRRTAASETAAASKPT